MPQTREQIEVLALLKKHGAVLERTKKHKIWRFPDGRIHVLPGTPSCAAAWKNQLHDLRNFLGEVDPERGKPGERREKKIKSKPIKKRMKLEALPIIAKDFSGLMELRERLGSGTAEAASELSSPPTRVDLPVAIAPSSVSPSREKPSTWWKFWTWKIWHLVLDKKGKSQ